MSDRLNPNDRLLQGQFITSADGRFTLILQGDGNLVLYKPGGRPIWATGTSGPVTEAVMQQDGNFVLYTPQGPIWASNTQGNNVLVAQNDGNLVMYNGAGGAVWASNTSGDLHLQRSSPLGSGHYMDTNVALTPDGKLSVTTRTRTVTWFGGFTGGVMVGMVDANGIVLDRAVNRFGVDGTAVGRSDRTEPWEAYFSPDTANRATQLFIAHYWDPKVKMEEMVRIGIIVVEIIVEILRQADADIALGG
jgi:hypothetical protein